MTPTALAKKLDKAATDDAFHLLLVDDDLVYLELCQRHLQRLPSTQVHVDSVGSIREAHEACQQTRFDCLLVDYLLPDGYGTDIVELLSTCQKQPPGNAQPVPPVIIVTADPGQHAATQAIRAGAADFIAKRNITPQSLNRAVSHAVERWRLQQSVIERNLALEQAYTLLESANQQLESKRREILNFYHTVSHEVKTPLAAAREFVALLRDGVAGEVNASQRQLLEHAMQSCDQIRSQFTELLDLARIDNDKLRLRASLTTLDPLIDRCLASVAERARNKQIALNPPVFEHRIRVRCDVDRIVQVLSNLLDNAVRYTPAGGNITLSLQDVRQTGKVRFLVADTGCGIERKYQKLIFERLYQIEDNDEARDSRNGLGLGLSICQELLSLHDSRLHVHSVPGSGSCFSFELPREEEIHNGKVKAQ